MIRCWEACIRCVEHSGVSKESRMHANDDFCIDSLLADLPEEVRPEDRMQLGELMVECRNIFSVAEGDLG